MKILRPIVRARGFISILLTMAGALGVVSIASAEASQQDKRLSDAAQVLDEMRSSRDQNVPAWLLERAYGVVVIPDLIKVGLAIGGQRGNGVLVVRHPDGRWSNPVFVTLTGGSLGLQMGVQSADLLLVFTSKESVEGIVGGKVTLGADASVAAGPIGRQTAAGTDIGFTAQVYSYSRTKGLFAGIALDGSAVTIDGRSNAAYYNRSNLLASEIVASTTPPAHESAQSFTSALDRMLQSQPVNSATSTPASKPAAVQQAEQPPDSRPASTAAKTADPSQLTTRPLEDPNPGAEPPQ